MDRETAITRALAAFWQEIETLCPQTFYNGISEQAFTNLREAAAEAIAERVDGAAPTRNGLLQKHWGDYTPRIIEPRSFTGISVPELPGDPLVRVKGAYEGDWRMTFEWDGNAGGIVTPDGAARLLPCVECGVCYWLPVNTVSIICDECANREATEARLAEHYVRRYAEETGRPESDYRGKIWVTWDSDAKVYDLRGDNLPAHPDCADLYPNGWSLLDHIDSATAITYR